MASTRNTSRNYSQITGNDQFRDSRVLLTATAHEVSSLVSLHFPDDWNEELAPSGMRNSFVMKQGLKQALNGLFQPVLKYFL